MSALLRSTAPYRSILTGHLPRQTLLLLVSNVGGGALLFALSVLIGRALGRDGLGVYSVVLAWVLPLTLLVDFGLSTLATRDVAQAPETASGQLAQMASARLLLGGAAMLAVVVAAPALSSDPTVIAGLRLSAPLLVIMPMYSSFTAVFKALGAMWPIPWLNLGMLVAQVGLSLMALALGGDVVALLLINTLTSAGQLVAAWLIWRRAFRPRQPNAPQVVAPRLPQALRRAWPFALAAVFAALQMRVSLILLESAATVDEVAYFAAASRFVEAARLIPNAYFGALFPALSALAAQPETLRRTFRRALLFLSLFGVVAVVAGWLLAAPAVRLTYGDAFQAAAPVLQVLALALLFSLLRGGYTLALYARSAEGRVNVVNGATLGAQVLLSLWLIPQSGAVGAALAVCAAEALAFVGLWREQRSRR